jgi:hypothetical protein
MQYMNPRVAIQLAADRHAADIEAAARDRRARREPGASLRRSIGHRIIRLGQVVAAESPLELARPR